MKLLSFNCRGLGNPETVGELHNVVRKEVPQVVFFMETRLEQRYIEGIRVRLGMGGALGVSWVCIGGGLALLWVRDLKVVIRSYSIRHIDAVIKRDGGEDWRLTAFYGDPIAGNRHLSWDLLRRLKSQYQLSWLVLGDLNEILHNEEQRSQNNRPCAQMERFRDVIDECNL